MSSDALLRIAIDIVIVVCIVFGWWFIALPLGVVMAWMMPYYLELVMAGFLYDALFGMGHGLGILGFVGTITALVLFLAASFFRLIVKT